jgi:hypothetical protein
MNTVDMAKPESIIVTAAGSQTPRYHPFSLGAKSTRQDGCIMGIPPGKAARYRPGAPRRTLMLRSDLAKKKSPNLVFLSPVISTAVATAIMRIGLLIQARGKFRARRRGARHWHGRNCQVSEHSCRL